MKQISEQEVQARRVKARTSKIENNTEEAILEPAEEIRVDTINIDLETKGRFDVPEHITVKPFTGRDVNNIILSKPEKIMNSLVLVLNDCILPQGSFKVEDMLPQEFLELMIGIKAKSTKTHTHRWLCDCQSSVNSDDQIVNESVLDMNNFTYKSIEHADKKLREKSKPIFDKMSEEEFKKYKKSAFALISEEERENMTKDQALEKIRITEPIKLTTPDHTYEFRFSRVGDIVYAQKESDRAFAFKFKEISNKKWDSKSGISLADFKNQKENDMEEAKELQAKYGISVYQSLRLLRVDGKEINSLKERIDIYDKIDENYIIQFNSYISDLEFGLQQEEDFVCPLCQNIKRRSLQREFDPIEFLRVFDVASGEYRHDPRCTISFGI